MRNMATVFSPPPSSKELKCVDRRRWPPSFHRKIDRLQRSRSLPDVSEVGDEEEQERINYDATVPTKHMPFPIVHFFT